MLQDSQEERPSVILPHLIIHIVLYVHISQLDKKDGRELGRDESRKGTFAKSGCVILNPHSRVIQRGKIYYPLIRQQSRPLDKKKPSSTWGEDQSGSICYCFFSIYAPNGNPINERQIQRRCPNLVILLQQGKVDWSSRNRDTTPRKRSWSPSSIDQGLPHTRSHLITPAWMSSYFLQSLRRYTQHFSGRFNYVESSWWWLFLPGAPDHEILPDDKKVGNFS